MKNRLIQSRPFDVHKITGPGASAAVTQVMHLVERRRAESGRRLHNRSKVRAHVRALILDLYVAFRTKPFLYIAISRRPSDYSGPDSRYAKLFMTHAHTVGVLDDLLALGLAKQWKGWKDQRTKIGYRTRIRARRKLIEVLDAAGIKLDQIEVGARDTIVLRDSSGRAQEFEVTPDVQAMQRNLDRINRFILDRTRIRLYLSDREIQEVSYRMARERERGPLDFSKTTLHRVFNDGSFERGGRFYGGWWQTVPKQYRKYIEINYKPTVEVDYSGMHPRMLYAMAGLEAPTDPYDLPAIPRAIQKKAVFVLLNAPNIASATRALQASGVKQAGTVVEALARRHPSISQYFGTGIGVYLQFLDSQIAEEVMLGMIGLGGMALPVHDSFILRIGREAELKQLMESAFDRHFPAAGAATKEKPTVLADQADCPTENVSSEPKFKGIDLSLFDDFDKYKIYYK